MDRAMSVLLLCLSLAAVLILVKYFQKLLYWKRNNVPTLSCLKLLLATRKSHVALILQEIYQKMSAGDKPLVAIENPFFSVLILRDLEAIKAITTTNYENFPDRGFYVNNRDPICLNIARLEYERWKPLRLKLNSVFTPSKIKAMYPTLLKVAKQFVEQLLTEMKKSSAGTSSPTVVEIRDLCLRFNVDIIGNVIFGLECHSLKEPNTEFRLQSEKGFVFQLPLVLDHIGAKYPKLLNFFNLKVHSPETTEFYARLVRETVEYREKHHIRRHDAMDTLIELKNEDKTAGDCYDAYDFIAAQAFALFLAGTQSSANTLAFALYELAKNPEIQAKARNNLQQILQRYNNSWTYDSLQDMVYLKQIILETLRKYPVGATQPRLCRRSCMLHTQNGSYHIKAGSVMTIPVYAIHHDPLYYPEPEKFRPERFDEEEVAQRPPHSYMSFGNGPKACLADRFAKANLTLVLAQLLWNFQFSPCERTPPALVFDPKNMFILNVKDGIHLKVEKI